jgi:hypothetical protein
MINTIIKTFQFAKRRGLFRMFKKLFILSLVMGVIGIAFVFHTDKGYRELEYRLGEQNSSWEFIQNTAESLDFIGWKNEKSIEKDQTLKIVLTDKNWKKIKKYGTSHPPKKKWVKAQVLNGEDSLDVKVKLHGTNPAHYVDDKFSYTVKLKTPSSFLKSDRYKLLKGEEFFPAIIALNNLAAKYGLISPTSRMVELELNGKVMGHYSFGQDIRKDLINNFFGHKDWTIIANIEDWNRKEKINNPAHISDFDLDYSHIKSTNDSCFGEALGVYRKVVELISDEKFDSLSTFFDEQYMGKFLAFAYLFNDSHFLTGDNVKWIYNQKLQKLYPVFRIETEGLSDRGILSTLDGKEVKNSYPYLDQSLWLSHQGYIGAKRQLIFKSLVKNEAIRHQRNLIFSEMIKNKDSLILDVKNVHTESAPLMLKYGGLRRKYELRQKTQLITLQEKLKVIKSYLKYNQVFYTHKKSKNTFEFTFDSFVRVRVEDSRGELFSKSSFNLGPNFERDYRSVEISSNNVVGDLLFINEITNDTINQVYGNFIVEFKPQN